MSNYAARAKGGTVLVWVEEEDAAPLASYLYAKHVLALLTDKLPLILKHLDHTHAYHSSCLTM